MASLSDGSTVNVDATATPGLLRLPPEVRLQIYELLATDKLTLSPYISYNCARINNTEISKLPLIHVCKRLRYEAIPFFYSKVWWVIECSSHSSSDYDCVKLLQTFDPYALQCVKGVALNPVSTVAAAGEG